MDENEKQHQPCSLSFDEFTQRAEIFCQCLSDAFNLCWLYMSSRLAHENTYHNSGQGEHRADYIGGRPTEITGHNQSERTR